MRKTKKESYLGRRNNGGADAVIAARRLANSLLRDGDFARAEGFYRDVLRQVPNDFEALHMLGVIALRSGRAPESVELIRAALRYKSKHAQAYANLGTALLYAARPDDAIQAYDKSLALDSNVAGVLSNLGTTQQLLQRYGPAAESFRRLLKLSPTYDFAVGNFFQCRRYDCDWRDFEEHAGAIRRGLTAGANSDRPFPFLSVSGSGLDQLKCANAHAAYLCPTLEPALWRNERYGHDRIRVAYVSADNRNHVVMKLLEPTFERHDRNRFHTIGISFARDVGGGQAAEFQSAFEQFVDASAMTDPQAAKLLRDLEVDIAVDLTGFTEGCRPGVFARRPAPVQVNFLGYPGTMGTPFHDYLIADDFVVPESNGYWYSERIVRLPDTFQANGRRSTILPATSRAEAGLPENAVVLCSFNNAYKLNPTVFDIWARVMQQVPDSVLWLVAERPTQEQHLRDEAQARGICSARLIFARRLPFAEHLSRLRLADLFLDSFPFNAGATAGDALWAGVPVVTCAGEAFASRMAGSVLRAIGLDDLIAFNPRDYERLVIDLAGSPPTLAALKARLAHNRDRLPLFDQARYCKHLESAYEEMWQRIERGEPAADISIQPPLSRHAAANKLSKSLV